MNIVAVIPAYNEEGRIEHAVRDAAQFVSSVIVVDDCSKDATQEKALAVGARVLRHMINRGQGAALQTGMHCALHELDADIIVHFDADGQMQGKDIPAMVDPIIHSNAEVSLGSRFLGKESNMPFVRRWLTLKPAIIFTKLISGIKVSDTHNGFRALSRKAAKKVNIKLDRMAHASEILDQIKMHNLTYTEVPVEILYSQETLAKGQSFSSGFTILKDFFKNKFFG
jgi:polyprenyl-phospho-N-acetylgalactosaminyl synthase